MCKVLYILMSLMNPSEPKLQTIPEHQVLNIYHPPQITPMKKRKIFFIEEEKKK